jgi:hypothetical protein
MEPKDSSSCSQEPVTCSYREPDESGSHFYLTFAIAVVVPENPSPRLFVGVIFRNALFSAWNC